MKIILSLELDFEGKGINGNTTENPAKLKSLLENVWLSKIPLYYQANEKDSVKLKSNKILSLGVIK